MAKDCKGTLGRTDRWRTAIVVPPTNSFSDRPLAQKIDLARKSSRGQQYSSRRAVTGKIQLRLRALLH